MERSSTIKRRDAVATRASILAAAHQRFLREAYENVGLRDIAGDAGVDVALISRYFGGKEGLFREVVSDEAKPHLFREPKSIDELPGFLAQLVAEDDDADRHHRMEMFVIMLRSASSPKAGDIIRELVNRDVLEPLAGTIGGDQGEMRANMLLAILMGVGVLRTIMKVDNFELDAEEGAECVERFRCLFAAALTC
ncbi:MULTISPECIES: TetR/AcrR family transcriptional regulator [Sphingopyxis]|uniref:Transcriptional regulator, TetR family n=1 Tax=Sphingopyxis terrae subsp. ummariensis TaxID=429001 RepID=A0A1Y6FUE6_9SPHN|nr:MULTISPECIES: TetR family transcriptional regulator [Sphingopyxis]MBU7589116.1 TetR family transcriptional regulator [Sphingopyxis terrae]MDX8358059.1 TetR family transcriptional regulator [Sphingopyxis terrae]SMQ78980.1 transcriptional regulator, TetR family [Sphingopyxis terrae subsp. ummariensis]